MRYAIVLMPQDIMRIPCLLDLDWEIGIHTARMSAWWGVFMIRVLVVNPITVGNFAFLFNCTPVGRTSNSMTVQN